MPDRGIPTRNIGMGAAFFLFDKLIGCMSVYFNLIFLNFSECFVREVVQGCELKRVLPPHSDEKLFHSLSSSHKDLPIKCIADLSDIDKLFFSKSFDRVLKTNLCLETIS